METGSQDIECDSDVNLIYEKYRCTYCRRHVCKCECTECEGGSEQIKESDSLCREYKERFNRTD